MERLWPYWGYAALAVAIFGLIKGAAVIACAVLAVASFSYYVFWVPVWCGASNRDDGTFCRENSHGLLLGCYRRQHKYQKFKGLFYRGRWKALNQGLWVSPTAVLGTVGGLISVGTFGWALVEFLVRS